MPKPRLVTAHGRSLTLREWSRELGRDVRTLGMRLQQGVPADAAMVSGRTTPDRTGVILPAKVVHAHGRSMTVKQWAAELGVPRTLLDARLRDGLSPDAAMTSVRRKCGAGIARARGVELYPGANDKPWADDVIAQAIVDELGTLTYEEAGRVLGLSRERVRQIEAVALRKMRLKLRFAGSEPQLRAMLAALLDEREAGERVWPEPCVWGGT